MTRPRLTFTAVTRPGLSRADCLAEVRHFGYGIGAEVCLHPDGLPAFHAVVTNVGGRTAWVSDCTVEARDAAGRSIPGGMFSVPMWLTQPGVGARPALDPGARATLDWFLPHALTTMVVSYGGSCSFVEYHNRPI